MRYALKPGSYLNTGRPRTCAELKNRSITVSIDPDTVDVMDVIAKNNFQGNRSKYILFLVDQDIRRRAN